jgi:hypothetical protein
MLCLWSILKSANLIRLLPSSADLLALLVQHCQNLYLARDFVKNAIDLACMEGAVSAALETAGQILGDHGETTSLSVAQVPPVWLVAARILLIPIVAVARLIAWLEEKLSPHRQTLQTSAARRRRD